MAPFEVYESKTLARRHVPVATVQPDALGVPQRTEEIRQDDLDGRLAAAVMNSWSPGIPVARIGVRLLGQDQKFIRTLHDAYTAEPAEPVS